MIEKIPIAFAEMIFIRLFVGEIVSDPLASAAADEIIAARSAFLRNMCGPLNKPDFFPAGIHGGQAVFIEISQPIIIQHIKIARVRAAIGLRNNLNSATPPLTAGFRRPSGDHGDIIVKFADISLRRSAYHRSNSSARKMP